VPYIEFQGCRDRIERANAHRKALGEIWNDLDHECFYNALIEVQDDGTGTICVYLVNEMPSICALELGEALYHLRAALDGAVYAAAIVESGQDPPPDQNSLEFPVCVSTRNFKQAARKIAPLSQECRDYIESVQPYNTPKLAPELRVVNINRTIGILSDWARKDRHRQLHVVASWASSASPKILLPDGASLRYLRVSGDGFLENNSEIARFAIDGFVPEMKRKVKANPDLAIDIAVNEKPKPCADNDTLGQRLTQMIAWVSIIVSTLEGLVTKK
jgi:hypothetical protein